MKLLDSLREQYTRYQEVCRQRSKRTQLEEIQQKVMQVSLELFLYTVRWRFELKVLDCISYKSKASCFLSPLKLQCASFTWCFTLWLPQWLSTGYSCTWRWLSHHAEEPSCYPFVVYCGSVLLVWYFGKKYIINVFNIFFSSLGKENQGNGINLFLMFCCLKLDLHVLKLLSSLNMQKMEWMLLLTFQHSHF